MTDEATAEAVTPDQVEHPPDPPTAEPAPAAPPSGAGTVLAVAEDQQVHLAPIDVDQTLVEWRAYQRLTHEFLDESDWQEDGDDKFPKKSAFRKLGRAFRLRVEKLSSEIVYDEDGRPQRAEFTARAIAPNGQFQDATGYCALSEFKGGRANDPKMLQNMAGTAETRAKNRAIGDLVGMGEVSAEEVGAGGGNGGGRASGAGASEELKQAAGQAALTLAGGDADVANTLKRKIVEASGGYLAAAAGQALVYAAACAQAVLIDGAPTPPPDDGVDPPPDADVVSDPPADAKPTGDDAIEW